MTRPAPVPATRPPARITPAGVADALPDAAFALVFAVTWVAPSAPGAGMIRYLLLVMLLEFITIHASVFMGRAALARTGRAARVRALLGFGAFYTLFVGGWSVAFRVWWPVLAFWVLTANRVFGVLFGRTPTEAARRVLSSRWAASTACYVGGAALTAFLPIPALGVSRAVVRTQHLPGSGLWIDEPQRALAFGFLYYLGVALTELWSHPAADAAREGAR